VAHHGGIKDQFRQAVEWIYELSVFQTTIFEFTLESFHDAVRRTLLQCVRPAQVSQSAKTLFVSPIWSKSSRTRFDVVLLADPADTGEQLILYRLAGQALRIRRVLQLAHPRVTQGLTQRPPEDSADVWMPLEIPGQRGEGEKDRSSTVNSVLSLRSRRPALA